MNPHREGTIAYVLHQAKQQGQALSQSGSSGGLSGWHTSEEQHKRSPNKKSPPKTNQPQKQQPSPPSQPSSIPSSLIGLQQQSSLSPSLSHSPSASGSSSLAGTATSIPQLQLPHIDLHTLPLSPQSSHTSSTRLLKNASTASISSVQSAATVTGPPSPQKPQHLQPSPTSKSLQHSYSLPARSTHNTLASSASLTSIASTSSRRRSPTVSSRLYTDPFTQAQLQHDASHALIPFVPRPLTPLTQPSALVSQWMAMLAWETGASTLPGSSPQARLERVAALARALEAECIRHVEELKVEVVADGLRRSKSDQIVQERYERRLILHQQAFRAEQERERKRCGPIVRFGGQLTMPTLEKPELPPTFEIPQAHTAFVCDLLDKIAGDFGRITPILRRILRLLFTSVYQGYDCEYNHEIYYDALNRKMRLASCAPFSEDEKPSPSKSDKKSHQASSPSNSSTSSAATSPSSLEIVPYFHVAHLLNLEWHSGQALIHSYEDTQASMHIQSLSRGDILNGAVTRMQVTLKYHVFHRWLHVVKERKRQLMAQMNLQNKLSADAKYLVAWFMKWKQITQLQRSEKNKIKFETATNELTQLQVKSLTARKTLVQAQDNLKSKKDLGVYLQREIEEVQRNLNWTLLQQSAMNDVQIHRLLDSSFELLLQCMDSLLNELDIARGLNLQDPLRILHPARTSWDWDSVYQDTVYGSSGWFLLRQKEVEATRTFFDGSRVQYESTLAHTHADPARSPSPSSSPTNTGPGRSPKTNRHKTTISSVPDPYASTASSASLASNSLTPYNYSQEIEIILLWFNFHLVQNQSKILTKKHEKKAQLEKKRLEREKRMGPPPGKSGHSPNKRPNQGEEKVSIEDDVSESEASSDSEPEIEWFDGTVSKKRTNRPSRKRSSQVLSAPEPESEPIDPELNETGGAHQLKSRSYFLSQFTSADALARRCENMTTSLQDSELFLRLLCEIAPEVADMDLLTHIDLGTRARSLIRMLERLNPDLSGMVTSLDFVHAFNSDRVAGLLARLMVSHFQVPIQGAWFDRHDWQNRSRNQTNPSGASSSATPTKRTMLIHTDPARLAEQMAETKPSFTGSHSGREEDDLEDFGPLIQLSKEIVQLQQTLQKRHRVSVIHVQELHTIVKQTLSAGRRILDDAYARHDLWLVMKTRMKSFVTVVFAAHLRGRPLKLEDPKVQKEKEAVCACVESETGSLQEVLRRQREQQQEQLLREFHRQNTLGSEHHHHPNQQSLYAAIEKFSTISTGDTSSSSTDENIYFPHGKPQQRFMDLLSPENQTYVESPDSSPRPSSPSTNSVRSSSVASNYSDATTVTGFDLNNGTTLEQAHILSFELHIIQNLLMLFYDTLKHIWRAYAQADTSSSSGIFGSNSMNLIEFWSFIKDCGLMAPGQFTTKQVEQVFFEVFMTREEKQNKQRTIKKGFDSLTYLTALQFDPITGQTLPPKTIGELELSEREWIEVLVRIAFLRKWKTKDEKQQLIDEWKVFQTERVMEMERERTRMEEQAKRGSGLNETQVDEVIPVNPSVLDPLAKTMTGRRATFNANMHDSLGMKAADPLTEIATNRTDSVDETYGLDFNNPDVMNHLNLGLSLRFFGMLKLKILPKASKLDADTFRSQYKTTDVSKLFRKHGAILRKLFFKYATLHTIKVSVVDGAQADSWSNTIDYQEFVTMLKDLHLMVDASSGLGGKEASKMLLTSEQCYSIFANVQQELHVANSGVVNSEVKKKSSWEMAVEDARNKNVEKEKSRRELRQQQSVDKTNLTSPVTTSTKKGSHKRKTTKNIGSISVAPNGPTSPTNSTKKKKDRSSMRRASMSKRDSTDSNSSIFSKISIDELNAEKNEEPAPAVETTDSVNDSTSASSPPKITILPSTRDDHDSDEEKQGDSSTSSPRRPHQFRLSLTNLESAPGVDEPVKIETDTITQPELVPEITHLTPPSTSHQPPSDGLILDSSSGAPTPDPPIALDLDHDSSSLSTNPFGTAASLNTNQSSDNSEMIYPEYLEALAAIACYRYPNPYKSTGERIETFLEVDLLPQAPKLLKKGMYGAGSEDY